MYWTCAEVLTLAAQLGTAHDLPQPDVLRRRIATLLEEMDRRGAEAKIPRRDLDDARYAIVAFIDEQLFRSSWSGRQQWMLEPLQLTYFNENTAGEGFFTRAEALEKERPQVLQVYYLCLALGFQGKYAVKNGDGLGALIERLGAILGRQLPSTDLVSPHGTSPDARRGRAGREAPVLLIGAGVITLAVLVFVGLRVALSAASSDATLVMQKAAAPPASARSGTR